MYRQVNLCVCVWPRLDDTTIDLPIIRFALLATWEASVCHCSHYCSHLCHLILPSDTHIALLVIPFAVLGRVQCILSQLGLSHLDCLCVF